MPPVPHPFTALVAQRTSKEVLVLGTEVWRRGTGRRRSIRRPAGGGSCPAAARAGRHRGARREAADRLGSEPQRRGPRSRPRTRLESLPSPPFDFSDCSPQGTVLGAVVFAEHCGQGALWLGNVRGEDSWERIPHPRSLAELPVWTGKEALFWVGRFAGSADGVWLYSPSPRASTQAEGAAAGSLGREPLEDDHRDLPAGLLLVLGETGIEGLLPFPDPGPFLAGRHPGPDRDRLRADLDDRLRVRQEVVDQAGCVGAPAWVAKTAQPSASGW